jgi:hypothetical protein
VRADTPVAPPPANPAPATQPAPPLADKSQYTLVNPTPANQMREMDTDRPNVANTPHTIDAGHLQVETGLVDYTFNRDEAPGFNSRSDTWDLGEMDFRLGVLNDLEVNAQILAYSNYRLRDFRSGQTSRADGFGDSSVGGKLNLWGNDGGDDDAAWSNALAIEPQLTFPTAGSGVSTGHFQMSVAFPFLMNLPGQFHLSIQPSVGYVRNSTDMGYTTAWNTAIALDRLVLGNLDVYLEYAANPTSQAHVKTPQTIDVGATYPLGNNVVLDTGFFVGLNDSSPTVEWTSGFSVRF